MEDFKVTQQHVIDDINNNTESWFGKKEDNNPFVSHKNLVSLLQHWTDLVVSLEHCDMLDRMREYDMNIDAHDSWVEFGYDELEEVQKELKDVYGIELKYKALDNDNAMD